MCSGIDRQRKTPRLCPVEPTAPEKTVVTDPEKPVIEPEKPLVETVSPVTPEKPAELNGKPAIVTNLLDLEHLSQTAKTIEAVEPIEKVCNCNVRLKGRGKHAQTCPKWHEGYKPKPTTLTTATDTVPPGDSVSQVADLLNQPTASNLPVNYQLIASAVFDMSANGLAMGLGPEWQPQNPQERKMVVDCMAVYFESKEIKDLPPGLMLTMVIGMYALPRLNKPSTASKIRIGWTWVKEKFRRKSKPVAATTPNIQPVGS